MSGREVPPEAFREVMAALCAPVSVVTTETGDGQPYGATVSAVASLSLRPPLVSIALDRASTLLAHIQQSNRVGINLLAHEQQATAAVFARSGVDRFAGVGWRWEDGLPRIDATTGWLAADVESFVPAGDHVILVAAVRAAKTYAGLPLVYAHRRYGTHSGLRPESHNAE
ncbi:flavin reductase family protein [Rhodococcus enclensis]|nr:flavin reductase family protein [Rhodococcus qingshengii]